jgi:type IV pilus assembly protein PilN
MTRINLLPWREIQRKEKQRQFASIAIGAVILMSMIILYIHMYIGGQIKAQNARNDYLKSEIASVDKKIKEIQELESEKKNLLSRMNVIQQLQGKRPEIVHLFYELMRNVPSGIYLTGVAQKGSSLVIDGVAQSNARVSAFMRNLDMTDWLENPRLEVIQSAKGKGAEHTSTFKLHVQQTQHGLQTEVTEE